MTEACWSAALPPNAHNVEPVGFLDCCYWGCLANASALALPRKARRDRSSSRPLHCSELLSASLTVLFGILVHPTMHRPVHDRDSGPKRACHQLCSCSIDVANLYTERANPRSIRHGCCSAQVHLTIAMVQSGETLTYAACRSWARNALHRLPHNATQSVKS